MRARARIDFILGLKCYKVGDLVTTSDDQVLRLEGQGLVEVVRDESGQDTGSAGQGRPAPAVDSTKALGGPPAHKMVTGGNSKGRTRRPARSGTG